MTLSLSFFFFFFFFTLDGGWMGGIYRGQPNRPASSGPMMMGAPPTARRARSPVSSRS
jgi:hypothetical protein